MGKSLVINGADFSVNGILVNIIEMDADWIASGFVYANDNKLYGDGNFRLYAFHLTTGQTVKYSVVSGGSDYSNKYGKVQISTADGHIADPGQLSTTGVNIGVANVIKSIAAYTPFPAVPETTYTAESNVTLYIGCHKFDTVTVLTEL